MPPEQLPSGASPECTDMEFIQGGVRTRGGLTVELIGANPTSSIVGLAEYAGLQQQNTLIAFDEAGTLYQESTPGALSIINSSGLPFSSFNSNELFGRLYMGFGNRAPYTTFPNQFLFSGTDIPRQWDGTNYDRVSQVGPGLGPTPQNYLPAPATIANTAAGTPVNIGASPIGLELSGPVTTQIPIQSFVNGRPTIIYITNTYYTILTLTTTGPHGLSVGQLAQIAGAANPFYDQTFSVVSVPSPTIATFSVHFINSTGNSGGGTVTGLAASAIRNNNIVTINTGAAHGFQQGWYVQIAGLTPNALPGSVVSMVPNSGTLTVTMSQPHNLQVGAEVTISGASDDTADGTFPVATVPSATVFTLSVLNGTAAITGATITTSFNGNFQIATVPTTTSFTYFQIDPNETQSNAGATATIVGSISPGLHGVAVSFITRQGYITPPSPPIYYNANGGELAALANIPTGPSNIVGRLLMFTPAVLPPATSGAFYSLLPAMQINDNTTTSAIIDFLDEPLILGFSAQYLFSQIQLGECFGAGSYNGRTVWLGERASISNLVNLTFDGGWSLGSGTGGSDVPLGWTSDPTNGAGGSRVTGGSTFGDAYAITGNGTSQMRGMIYQSAYQDYNNVTIFGVATQYSQRARLYSTTTTGPVDLIVDIYSPSQGILGVATLFSGSLTTTPIELTVPLLSPQTSMPPDAVYRLYTSNFLANGTVVIIDYLEPFQTNQPVNTSIARFSYASNPESIDAVTGQITVTPNDGEQLKAGFPIRGNYYLAKDNYLASVTDDGVNEPAFWPVIEVSNKIGICGPNAWDAGEEWAAFVHKSGVYLFWGSDPVKISEEIQYDASNSGKISWADVNWLASQTVWVKIDQIRKKIYVGLPMNGASDPNYILTLDYEFAPSGEATASLGSPSYSTYTGKIIEHGGARKWMPWVVACSSACISLRPDGSSQLFLGRTGLGYIWGYNRAQLGFDQEIGGGGIQNVGIFCSYGTYGSPDAEEEQGLQLTAHRKLADYLTGYALGNGTMAIVGQTAQRSYAVRGVNLTLSPTGDWERPINIESERVFWILSTSEEVGWWFQLTKLIPVMKTSPTTPVRGLGA